MSSLSKIGEILSISELKGKVYGLLLEHGTLDITTLEELTSIDNPKLEKILTDLKEKDLILPVGKEVERYHALPPFEILTVGFGDLKSETLARLNNLKARKERIITDFSEALNTHLEDLEEGIKEIKQQVEKHVEKSAETLEESRKILEELPLEEFSQDLKGFDKQSRKIFRSVRDPLKEVVNQGKKTVSEKLNTSMGSFKEDIKRLKGNSRKFSGLLTDIRADIEEEISQEKESFTETSEALKEKNTTKISETSNTFTQIQSELVSYIETFRKKLKAYVEDMREDLSSNFLASLSNLEEIYTRGVEKLERELFEKHKESISKTTETLKGIKVEAIEETKERYSKGRENITTNTSQLVAKQKKITEHVSSQFEALQNEVQGQVREFYQKQTRLLEAIRKKLGGNLEELLEETNNTLKGTKETSNESVSKLINTFTTVQDDIITEALETINTTTKMTVQTKLDISSSLREATSNIINLFSEEMKNIVQSQEHAIKEQTVIPLDTVKAKFRDILEEGQKEYASLFSKRKHEIIEEIKKGVKYPDLQKKQEKMSSLIEEGENFLKEIDKENQREKTENLEETFTKLKKEISSMSDTQNILSEEIINRIGKESPPISQQLSKITETIENRLKDLLKKERKESRETYRKKREEMWKSLEDGFTKMQDSMDNLLDESEGKLDAITNEIERRLNKTKVEMKENISGKIGKSQEIIRESKNEVFKQLSSLTNELEEKLSNVNMQLTEALKERKESSSQKIVKTEQYLEKQREKVTNLVNSSMNESENIINDVKSTLLEFNKNTDEITREKIEKAIEEANQALNSSKELAKNSISEGKEKLTNKIQKEKETIRSEIENTARKLTEHLKTEKKQIISELENEMTNKLSEGEQQLLKFQESFSELVVNAEEETTSIMNSIHNSLSDGIENINTKLKKEIKELTVTANQVANRIEESLFSDLKEMLQGFKRKQQEIMEENEAKTKESVEGLQEAFNTFQSNLKEKRESYRDLKTQFTQEIPSSMYGKIDALVDNIKEDSTKTQDKIKEKTEKCLQETQERLLRTIEQYQDLKETTSNIKETLMKITKEKIEDIWQIYGKRGILSQITSMIKRTEQSLTLITQKIPNEIIEALAKVRGKGVVLEVIIPQDLELKADLDNAWVRRIDKQIKGITVIRDGIETLVTPRRGNLDKGVLFTSKEYNLTVNKI